MLGRARVAGYAHGVDDESRVDERDGFCQSRVVGRNFESLRLEVTFDRAPDAFRIEVVGSIEGEQSDRSPGGDRAEPLSDGLIQGIEQLRRRPIIAP